MPADMDALDADPLVVMTQWLEDATRYSGKPNPHAAALATCGADGQPAARMLLLKGLDHRGAVVYTNLGSDKGRQIEQNPHAALLFHWDCLGRQLRIAGGVTIVDDEQADAYWSSRPWPSQIGGLASDQSRPLADRQSLADRVIEVATQYPLGTEVPRPPPLDGPLRDAGPSGVLAKRAMIACTTESSMRPPAMVDGPSADSGPEAPGVTGHPPTFW